MLSRRLVGVRAGAHACAGEAVHQGRGRRREAGPRAHPRGGARGHVAGGRRRRGAGAGGRAAAGAADERRDARRAGRLHGRIGAARDRARSRAPPARSRSTRTATAMATSRRCWWRRPAPRRPRVCRCASRWSAARPSRATTSTARCPRWVSTALSLRRAPRPTSIAPASGRATSRWCARRCTAWCRCARSSGSAPRRRR